MPDVFATAEKILMHPYMYLLMMCCMLEVSGYVCRSKREVRAIR